MKKKITYTNEPLGRVHIIKDFLPSPEELVLREESVKVTMKLSRASVDFFKQQAKKNRAPYQKMIRSLVDSYVSRYRKS